MNSRERIKKTLKYEKPDRVPIDFGATPVTGISVSVISKLKEYYKLNSDNYVKVIEPYQMLGEITEDLRKVIGIDCIALQGKKNIFGFENSNWKNWILFDGTKVLVPDRFNTNFEKDGSVLQYPKGNKSADPSGKMPDKGYYFDTIIRQSDIKKDKLKVEDNLEEFNILSEDELKYFEDQAEYLYRNTDLAIVANIGGMSFGDIALVPGPSLEDPKGIRDISEWYIATSTHKDFIMEIFDRQSEIALENLKLFYQAVGNKISVIFMSTTDFGTQGSPFLSNETYRQLYFPFQKKLNDWVHKNTEWKTFIHSCGSIEPLIEDFIEAGFDILNPLQLSASNMDIRYLKNKYGNRIVFWGGGVDTQKTLPFGIVEEVREEVDDRLKILSANGGFVFSSIHNIQPKTPIENIVSMVNTVHSFNHKLYERSHN